MWPDWMKPFHLRMTGMKIDRLREGKFAGVVKDALDSRDDVRSVTAGTSGLLVEMTNGEKFDVLIVNKTGR